MYELIFVNRNVLDICEIFYPTKKEAIDAMVADIILLTGYKTLEEIIDAANAGECGFSDDEAWAETSQCGTRQWKIVEVPEAKTIKVNTPAGVIVAEVKGSVNDYPGIWIFKDDNKPFNMMAAVEYSTPDERFQIEGYQTGMDEPRVMIDYETGNDLL